MASPSAPGKKITDPPTNVKEAIDWLIRIGRKDDTYLASNQLLDAFCSSVKSLVGNGTDIQKDKFEDLCKELGKFIGWEKNDDSNGHINGSSQGIGKSNESNGDGYKSAYGPKRFDTVWAPCVMHKDNSNGTKSCCTPPCDHCKQNQDKECEPEGCCERCPKRICAKIFIAIIPCLYGVVKFLKEMCNGSNGWSQQKFSDQNSQLSKFFTYLGYNVEKDLNGDVQGSKIHGLLNGSNDLEKKLKDVYDEIKKKYNEKNGTASTDSKTIRSMLQWLARMPATTTISQLKNGIDTKCQSLNNSPVLDKDSILPSIYATCAMSTFFLMGIERPDNMNKDTYFKELYVTENGNADDCCKKFLGQVPKLYHSFRFMLWISNTKWTSDNYNDKITAYLVSMGYDIGNIQNIQSGNPTTGANKLHETFKQAVEKFQQSGSTPPSPPDATTTYEPNGLKEIHDKLESYLKKLIEKEHTNALQSIAKGGTDTRRRPRTIRDMLHWLSGVPFSVGYSEMQQFSNSLCDLTKALKEVQGEQKMMHTIQPEWISYRLGVSCAECLDVLQAIEDPLGKEPTKRFEAYIKAHDFYYPASASELFYMFVDVIYNVYVQMKFVCNMTGRPKEEGGWERCNFWASKPLKEAKDSIVCNCMTSGTPFTCQLACRRFLDGSNDSFFRPKYPLSFNIKNITAAPLQARVIYNVIKNVFGYSNNYSVLCRLLLAVSTCAPTSIGDMISFLYWYRNKMFPSDGAQANNTNAKVYKDALHKEIELFPGTFDASKLTGALGALMKEHTGAGRTAAGGTTHNHNANMLSILDCYGNAEVKAQPQPQAQSQAQSPQAQQPSDPSVTCAPYLRPLAYDIYKIYVPQFSRAYLSWILHCGPRVYTALEEIKRKLNGSCSHCSDATNNGSIVTCNAVLPELYSKGLDFYDPKVLNGQRKNGTGQYQPNGQSNAKKTCTLFATQLSAVLKTCNPGDPSAPGAPLHRLIEAIEQFLWSIRLPFSLVQLSLWSVAILFISYVFVVPLDHFKIKSHLFNRLKYTMHPSLLIADQQRRVSEVAYFSL